MTKNQKRMAKVKRAKEVLESAKNPKVYTISAKTYGDEIVEDNWISERIVSNFLNIDIEHNYVGTPGYDLITSYRMEDADRVQCLKMGVPSFYLNENDPLNDIMPIEVDYFTEGTREGHIKSLKFISFTDRGYDELIKLSERLNKHLDTNYIEDLVWKLTD